VRHPILILAFGLSGLASQVSANPGQGDRYGSDAYLTQIEYNLAQSHPELATQAVVLQRRFDQVYKSIDVDVGEVLKVTDACTGVKASNLDPDERRDASWLLYLDKARAGPEISLIFKSPPSKK